LPALDALPGRTTQDLLAGFVRDVPELFALEQGRPHLETMNERKPLIVAAWDPYVDAHVTLAEMVQPDLVVYDPIFGVGALVAAKSGVPAVAHGVSISRYAPEMLRDLPAAVAFRRHGVEVPEGIQTIDVAPPSLAESPPSDLAMRFVPYNGGGVLPDWLLTPAERPRIAVTFGSLDRTRGFGYVEQIAAAAVGVDAEFVLTLGQDDTDVPHELPPNVRTTGWLPMNALLRTCSAAIHHGGGGTSLTCCALGVPQMVLSNGSPDMLAEAELLRARGAAHVMRDGELDQAAIRDLLADDKLRRVADELRKEIAALPAPAELVPRLTGLRFPVTFSPVANVALGSGV
jgi:UDP:flavonoid glycosyltransferase YjiC (YdhE family)